MSCVKVFECEGSFAFLEAPQRFTFRVFADNSLSVDVAPLERAGDEMTAAGTTQLHQEAAENDFDAEDIEEEVAGDEALAGGGGEEGGNDGGEADPAIATKVFAFDGRALPGRHDGDASVDKPSNDRDHECFIVHFKLVRWCRDPYSTQFIKCVGRLSSKRGLSGKCIDLENAMEEDAEGEDFKLRLAPPPCAGYRVEPVNNPLYPLTPGLYVLNGHTIGENGYVYECQVVFKLKPDGMALGSSRELLFPQECVLAGAWTRDNVNYLLQYHMDDNRCTYMYFGSPFAESLRGSWQNADASAFRSRAERGCLEFRLAQAIRVWSPAYHKCYPDHFREAVKLLLLVPLRADPGSPLAMPSHLMVQIVSFFGYDWFRRSEDDVSFVIDDGGGDDDISLEELDVGVD